MKKLLVIFVFLFILASVPMIGRAQTNSADTDALLQTLLKRIDALEKLLADQGGRKETSTKSSDDEMWANFEKTDDGIEITTAKKQYLVVKVQKYSKGLKSLVTLEDSKLRSNNKGEISVSLSTDMSCGEYIKVSVKGVDSDFRATQKFEAPSCSTSKIQADPSPKNPSGSSNTCSTARQGGRRGFASHPCPKPIISPYNGGVFVMPSANA